MRGDAKTMRLLKPSTPAEALELYAANPEAKPLAGGTDYMVGWNLGLLDGGTVLDLWALDAWRKIEGDDTRVTIGALATHAALQKNAHVKKHLPLLVEACATVGAAQIQNRGTLGGNLANASPAGDTFPPLAVYAADARIVSKHGTRMLPVRELFAGVKKTHLKSDELIEAVVVRVPKPPTRQVFRKVGSRAAQTISKAVCAGLLWLDGDVVVELRFAIGSVAPTVRRLKSVEAFVQGKPLNDELIEGALKLLEQDIAPIDDIRSTKAYRFTVCRNILRDFLKG